MDRYNIGFFPFSPGDLSQIFAKPETNWYKAEFGVVEIPSLWKYRVKTPLEDTLGKCFYGY